MKSSDTHYLKYLLRGAIIAATLLYFTGSWPITIAFFSAIVLCKLVEMVLDFFEGRAFGRMIGNIFSPEKNIKQRNSPDGKKKKWKTVLSDFLGFLCWLAFMTGIVLLVSLGSLTILESFLLVFGIAAAITLLFIALIKSVQRLSEDFRNKIHS